MNPLTYSLCQKPVIGVAMWITSLCVFPPLFQDKAFPLSQAGTSVTTEFDVSIEKFYPLIIEFAFPSVDARIGDKIVGTTYTDDCQRDYAAIPLERREALGRPIPVHVQVRHQGSGVIAVDQTFDTLCVTSHMGVSKTRTVGLLPLKAGAYTIEVRNVKGQPGLDGVKTSLALVAGYGK